MKIASLVWPLLLPLLLAGCRAERYYGPYLLQVPGPLQQDSVAHSFLLPLDQSAIDEQQQLEQCLADGGEDCNCRFPVLRVGDFSLQVDYTLGNTGSSEAAVMIWLGRRVSDQEIPPQQVAGMADVELLAEHHHHLLAGASVRMGFASEDIERAEVEIATALHPQCQQDSTALPGLQGLLLGLTLESGRPGPVEAVFSVLVDAGGWP
ncbi:MAG: hypothetical protein DRI34_08275 [Deltaproteobacteria bacterium]|nr:MAG: hypothetical protein DRI34_08275 [Deltaproteobacteria bacterium]